MSYIKIQDILKMIDSARVLSDFLDETFVDEEGKRTFDDTPVGNHIYCIGVYEDVKMKIMEIHHQNLCLSQASLIMREVLNTAINEQIEIIKFSAVNINANLTDMNEVFDKNVALRLYKQNPLQMIYVVPDEYMEAVMEQLSKDLQNNVDQEVVTADPVLMKNRKLILFDEIVDPPSSPYETNKVVVDDAREQWATDTEALLSSLLRKVSYELWKQKLVYDARDKAVEEAMECYRIINNPVLKSQMMNSKLEEALGKNKLQNS